MYGNFYNKRFHQLANRSDCILFKITCYHLFWQEKLISCRTIRQPICRIYFSHQTLASQWLFWCMYTCYVQNVVEMKESDAILSKSRLGDEVTKSCVVDTWCRSAQCQADSVNRCSNSLIECSQFLQPTGRQLMTSSTTTFCQHDSAFSCFKRIFYI